MSRATRTVLAGLVVIASGLPALAQTRTHRDGKGWTYRSRDGRHTYMYRYDSGATYQRIGNHAWYSDNSGTSGSITYGVTNPYAVDAQAPYGSDGKYLGRLSSNRYDPDSIGNSYGRYGSRYSPDSINNPYGRYGSRFSPHGVTNPYGVDAPALYGSDGKYLGRLSSNRYDPDSISNPYGRYGSRYSPDSVNNPYGRYGSRFSPYSPRNPYATRPPRVVKP